MAKLLVIDDEPDVGTYLQEYFERHGLEVLTATSGEAGLQLLQSAQPALVLLDLRLGQGMNGLDVLRQARLARLPAEIIVVTVVKDRDVAETARALGAADYITKPLVLEELERTVMTRLSGSPRPPESS